MGQPVAFFEVISPDQERAQKFYAELFGWQVNADPAMGGYALVDTGAGAGAVGGGIGAASARGGHRGQDLHARGRSGGLHEPRRATRRHAVAPPMELPGDFGTIAIIADPDGNRVGLWA